MATMTVYSEVKRLYSSLQEMVGLRRRKRQLQISEPFNFKKETTILPGLTEDEISVLREKAAASRLGIADADDTLVAPTTSTVRQPRMVSSGGGGPLCPLSPTPLQRLSIPIPIPTGANSSTRHGSSGLLSLSFATSSVSTGGGGGGGPPAAGLVDVTAPARMSVSMNDLDLLLFGNPSGVRMGSSGMGKKVELPTPMPVSAMSLPVVSPLELDAVTTNGGGGLDWDMEFDFQLGSPVSPLSPASTGGFAGGKQGLMT